MIQLLKHHRDLAFQAPAIAELRPISIIITTLAARAYERVVMSAIYETDYDLVLAVIEHMPSFIDVHESGFERLYVIANETVAGENFAEKWNSDPRLPKAFYDWHARALSAVRQMSKACTGGGPITSRVSPRAYCGSRMSERELLDDFARELQRHQLARRLIDLGARTHTIGTFTALSRHQLAALRGRWSVDPHARPRGPAPHSLAATLRSPRLRSELACAAIICQLFGLTYHQLVRPRRSQRDLEVGERLCDAYEAFLSCVPDAQVKFEHLLLLARGLYEGVEVAMRSCVRCGAAMLVDLLAPARPLCYWCMKTEVSRPRDLDQMQTVSTPRSSTRF